MALMCRWETGRSYRPSERDGGDGGCFGRWHCCGRAMTVCELVPSIGQLSRAMLVPPWRAPDGLARQGGLLGRSSDGSLRDGGIFRIGWGDAVIGLTAAEQQEDCYFEHPR